MARPMGVRRILCARCDDDQIVPFADAGELQAKLITRAELKVYTGAPHGLCSTLKDRVNADLLAFIAAPVSATR
jgi:hypothetical protein